MAQIKKRSTAERKFNELMSSNSLDALETKLKLTHILIEMGYKDGLNDPLAKDQQDTNDTLFPDGIICEINHDCFGVNINGTEHWFTLEELIKYGLSADGVWWLMCWNNPNFGNKNEINQNHDTLFYDEFVFLKTEKLIKYKSFTIKTLNQIYNTNF